MKKRYLIGCLIFLSFSINAFAETYTWDGGGDGSLWKNGNNWNTNTAPNPTVYNDYNIGTAITHMDGVNYACSEFFVSGGRASYGALLLSAGMWGNGSVTHGVTLMAPVSINSSGGLLSLTTVTAGTFTPTINAATDVKITTMTGSGGLVKNGAGTLQIGGAYSGTTTVNQGSLVATAALTNTTVMLNGTQTVFVPGGTVGGIDGSGTITGGNLNVGYNNADTAFGGTMTGAYNLQKEGTGTLRLDGANTYTGTTTVNGGTLVVNGAMASSSITTAGSFIRLESGAAFTGATGVSVVGSGGLIVNGSPTIKSLSIASAGSLSTNGIVTVGTADSLGSSIAGTWSGGGTLVKSGTQTLTVSGNAGNYTGNIRVDQGTLAVGASAVLDRPIENDGAVSLAGTRTYSSPIIGSGSLIKATGSTTVLTLNAANSYTGNTNVLGGTMRLGNGSAIASSAVVDLAGGTSTGVLDINGQTAAVKALSGSGIVMNSLTPSTPDLTIGGSAVDAVFSGAISGVRNVTKVGANKQTFSGATSYLGNTMINGGTFVDAGNLPNSTGVIIGGGVFTAASADTIGFIEGAGTLELATGSKLTLGDNSSREFSGRITGAGTLTKEGTGTLTISGNNSLTGTLAVNGGEVKAMTTPGTSSYVTIGSGALFDMATPMTIGSMNVGPKGVIELNGGNLTVGGDYASGGGYIYGSVIDSSGGGSLTKAGNGCLVVGYNINDSAHQLSYTGPTNINEGTFQLSGTSEVMSNETDVMIAPGALFLVGNTSNASVETVGSINGGGNVSLLQSGASLAVTDGGNFSGQITSNAAITLTVAGGTLNLTGSNTYTGTTNIKSDATMVLGGALGSSTGTTTVNIYDGGKLSIESGERLNNGATVNLYGGTFELAGGTEEVYGVTLGAGSSTIAVSNGSMVKVGPAGKLTNGSGFVNFNLGDSGQFYCGVTYAPTRLVNNILPNGTVNETAFAKYDTGTKLIVAVTEGDCASTVESATATTGSAILSANETFSGAKSINTLTMTNTAALAGTSALTLNGLMVNGTNTISKDLTLSSTVPVYVNGSLSTTGNISQGVNKMGTGTLTIAGGAVNLPAGAMNIYEGTVAFGKADATTGTTGTVNIAGGSLAIGNYNDTIGTFALSSGTVSGTGGVLTAASSAPNLYDGTVSAKLGGTLGITKADNGLPGGGNVTLSGSNTYSGLTSITGGTLSFGNNEILPDVNNITVNGTSAVLNLGGHQETINNLTITNGTITSGVPDGSLSCASALWTKGLIDANANIDVAGTLTASGANARTLTGTVSAGNFSIVGGSVKLQGSNRIADSTPVSVGTGTTLDLNGMSDTIGSLAGSGAVTNLGTLSTGSYSSTFSGSTTGGTLAKVGTGTMTLAGTNINSDVRVQEGTVQLANASAVNSGRTLQIDGGTFDMNNFGQTVAGLSGTDGLIQMGTASLTVNTAAATASTFSGDMSGSGGTSFIKTGSGTLTLSGDKTYTGATVVSGGMLVLNGSNSASDVTVGAGAMLGGNGQWGDGWIQSGAIYTPGNSPGLTQFNNLTWDGGGTYLWEIDTLESDGGQPGVDPGWDNTIVSADLTINGTEADPCIIDLTTLSHPAHEAAPLANFDKTGSYSWMLMQVSGTINVTDPEWWSLNTANFENDFSGGHFALRVEGGKQLWIDYTGAGGGDVPEPSTLLLLLPFIGFGLRKFRGKK